MLSSETTSGWRERLSGFVLPFSEATFSDLVAARTAGILFVVSGLITAATVGFPHEGHMFAPGVLGVGITAILAGVIILLLPARLWSPKSLFVLVPLTNLLIGLHNYWGGDPYRYAIFFVVAYAWLGFALPPGTSLKVIWIMPAAYLIPMWASGVATPSSVSSVLYVTPLCVLIAESMAWVVSRVRLVEGDLHRERSRAELADLEHNYRHLIEQIPAISFVTVRSDEHPLGWKFTYISPQLTDVLGADPAEWMADPRVWERGLHPDDRELVLESDRLATEHGTKMRLEYRFIRPDGRVVWLLESSQHVPETMTGERRCQGAFIDITPIKEAMAAAREANELHKSLVERLPGIAYRESIAGAGRGWVYEYVSPRVEEILGYRADDWIADPYHYERIIHPDDRAVTLAEDDKSTVSGEPFSAEYRLFAADGRAVWIHDEATLIHDDAGKPAYWHGIMLDITAQREAEAASREREAEFQSLFSQNPFPTWVFERDTHSFLEVNDAATNHYGYTREEFLALCCQDLLPLPDRKRFLQEGDCARTWSGTTEMQHRLHDGRVIDVETTSHELTFRGKPAVLVIAHDVTARNALQAQITHQAFHDALTGLPNRSLFSDRLTHAIRRTSSLAVLFVDLDDFKRINDTLGHGAGDLLLLRTGERLERCIRPHDTIARLGGDEFTILLEDCTEAEAIAVADRLAEELSEPFIIEGHELVLSPSIGIAIGGQEVRRTDELLRRADVAMYDAKNRGKARYSIFHETMDESAWERLSLESELRRAISGGQLRLHYQPILSLESGHIEEVEALVRWEHPERGLLYPNEFIPLAEETGLINLLGAWVLDEACRQAAEWSRLLPANEGVMVAVNLSARQFQQPTIVEDVARAIAHAAIDPCRLKIEITETVAMSDIGNASATLHALKKLGVTLAIDDFGAGYSGVSYLLRSPIDAIKIDRSYVQEISGNPEDRRSVEAVIAFAATLELQVVAEGVETSEQLATLRGLGVQRGQGFLFSRPVPADDLTHRLRTAAPALHAVAD